jgi:hypothetical protein
MADHPLTDRDRALLVALADGRLRGRRRADAEDRLSGIPGGHELVQRQRRVAATLQGGPESPASLAMALPEPARAARWRRPTVRLGLAAATAAAVAAAVVAVFAPSGGGASAADVAVLGTLHATQPAPEPIPAREGRLNASFEGVSYPNWGHQFGWHATGARSDEVDGRSTRTVYYEHMGHRIGYTVVSGEPLDLPKGAERISRDGVQIALFRDRDSAVFVRNGHTCILGGHVMQRSTLVKLAAWKGNGTLRF